MYALNILSFKMSKKAIHEEISVYVLTELINSTSKKKNLDTIMLIVSSLGSQSNQ